MPWPRTRAVRHAAALALCVGVGVVFLMSPARAATAPDRQLGFLHVGAAGGPAGLAQVLDSSGRQVLLRGVNVDGLVDYFRTDLRAPYPIDPSAYSSGACPPDEGRGAPGPAPAGTAPAGTARPPY